MENKSSERPNYNSAKALRDSGIIVKPIVEEVLKKLDWCIWKADLARIKQEK
jgi:hypothetical protein